MKKIETATIEIPRSLYEQLERRAAEQGKTVDLFAAQIMTDVLLDPILHQMDRVGKNAEELLARLSRLTPIRKGENPPPDEMDEVAAETNAIN